jgi:hypothetical protein
LPKSTARYIREARFVVEPGEYALVHLPDGARPDVRDALVWLPAPRDNTLVLPAAAADRLAATSTVLGRVDGWRMLTIEVEVPLDVPGFFVHFAKALGEAGVPIVPVAGYRCDHVLVEAKHVERAVAAMEGVRASFQG